MQSGIVSSSRTPNAPDKDRPQAAAFDDARRYALSKAIGADHDVTNMHPYAEIDVAVLGKR